MATKKSTTKAKTNTRKATTKTTRAAATKAKATTRAKAPAKRAPAKTAAKKTTSAAVVAPAVGKAEGNTIVKKLLELQRISAGVFILLALAAGYFIKNTTYNLTLRHLAHDDLASKGSTAFAPAVHGVYDLNLRWAVVAIMALSAIIPLLLTLRWRRQYEVNVDAEVMPQRWLDMAITSALMVEVVALLSGINDIMTLKIVAGLMVVTCALGWLADKQNRQADRPDWSAYVIALVTGFLPWLLIGATAVATYVYDNVRSPWYVYALYGVLFVGFGVFANTQRQHYLRANQWKFAVVERNYVLTNLAVKVGFALVLIAGLHR